jgi:phosphoenolpyruvate synthase/pyruvate phosphate dikinase
MFSGVVFTADTKTHDTNCMFINFVQGKCSDFVDSSKQSYFIKVDKRTMQIIETNKSIQRKVVYQIQLSAN